MAGLRIKVDMDVEALGLSGMLVSYADVERFAERLYGCAALLWPNEHQDHLRRIDEEQAGEEGPLTAAAAVRERARADRPIRQPDPEPAHEAAQLAPPAAALTDPDPPIKNIDPSDHEARRLRRVRILRMREDDGKSIGEIANIYNLSPNTISNELSRARRERVGM